MSAGKIGGRGMISEALFDPRSAIWAEKIGGPRTISEALLGGFFEGGSPISEAVFRVILKAAPPIVPIIVACHYLPPIKTYLAPGNSHMCCNISMETIHCIATLTCGYFTEQGMCLSGANSGMLLLWAQLEALPSK